VPEKKAYAIVVWMQAISAHKHVEGGARNSPPRSPSDLDFAVIWDAPPILQGPLDDPTHLHGKLTLMDRKTDITTETEVIEWDHQWEN
jgi:hypothetical protein